MKADLATSLFYMLVLIPSTTYLLYRAYLGNKWCVIAVCVFISMNYWDGRYKTDSTAASFFKELFNDPKCEKP